MTQKPCQDRKQTQTSDQKNQAQIDRLLSIVLKNCTGLSLPPPLPSDMDVDAKAQKLCCGNINSLSFAPSIAPTLNNDRGLIARIP